MIQQLTLILKQNTNDDLIENLCVELESFDASAVLLENNRDGDGDILEPEPGESPLWPHVRLKVIFEANKDWQPALITALSKYPIENWDVNSLNEDMTWLIPPSDHLPACFGNTLWIYAGDAVPEKREHPSVLLNPGLAFGTGSHPTTRLCLEAMTRFLKNSPAVIDYGCGSGILAISALALGARSVVAVDHDPQALVATQQQAVLNNAHIDTFLPKDFPSNIKADVVVANILLKPLLELRDVFLNSLQAEGLLILSGILKTQQQLLTEAYLPYTKHIACLTEDGWTCVVLSR